MTNQNTDPETLKIPAYLRNKAIVTNSRQRLLWTAWDRKEAGVKPNSKRKTGRINTKKRLTATEAKKANLHAEENEYLPRSITELDALHTRARLQAHQHESPIMEVAEQKAKQLFPSKPRKYNPVGETTHYLDKIDVAIIKLSCAVKENDILLIEGSGQDGQKFLYTQPVKEMQIDKNPVSKARKGDHIGLKVNYPAKLGGSIYKVF